MNYCQTLRKTGRAKWSHASIFYLKLPVSGFLFGQFWHANSVIRMKVALLTEGLQGQTGGEKDQKCRKSLKCVVVQVYMSLLKVLRYPPISSTVSLQARTAPNMARMFMWNTWSGDKLVSVYVCQVHSCASKPLSKHVRQNMRRTEGWDTWEPNSCPLR